MFIDFRERGRERDIKWLPLIWALTEDSACNLSMFPLQHSFFPLHCLEFRMTWFKVDTGIKE